MTSLLYWDATQRWLVVRYRRFGSAYGSSLQGSSSPIFLDWTLRNWCTYTLFYFPVDKAVNLCFVLVSNIPFLRKIHRLYICVYKHVYKYNTCVCLWRILLSASHSQIQVYLWSLNTSQYKMKISFVYWSFCFVGCNAECGRADIQVHACGVTKRTCGLQRLKVCLKSLMLNWVIQLCIKIYLVASLPCEMS
jgi:hypothetical protein